MGGWSPTPHHASTGAAKTSAGGPPATEAAMAATTHASPAAAAAAMREVQHTERPTILFDGMCGLCALFVAFVRARQRYPDQFDIRPLQSMAGRELLAKHSLPATLSTVVLLDAGRPWVRSTGVLRSMTHLGFPYALLYAFILVPVSIRDAAYKFVAKHRLQIFGSVKRKVPKDELDAAVAVIESHVGPRRKKASARPRKAATPVVVFSDSNSEECTRVKGALRKALEARDVGSMSPIGFGSGYPDGMVVEELDGDDRVDGLAIQEALHMLTAKATLPAVFVGGEYLGGCADVEAAERDGRLATLLDKAFDARAADALAMESIGPAAGAFPTFDMFPTKRCNDTAGDGEDCGCG